MRTNLVLFTLLDYGILFGVYVVPLVLAAGAVRLAA